MLTDNIFQKWFGKNNSYDNVQSGGAPFHDLYNASISFGGIAYRIMFILVLYICVITLLMHLAKLVLSNNPMASAEAKGKVMRVFIIAMFAGGVATVIALIVTAFAV